MAILWAERPLLIAVRKPGAEVTRTPPPARVKRSPRADGPEEAMWQIFEFTALRLGMQIHHARPWSCEREVWPALRSSAPQLSLF